MAKRKQTTASPEKMPMKTDRTRKKRSSRKTDRSKAPRDRRGSDATGTDCPSPVIAPVGECGRSSTLVPLVQFRDQKQSHVDSRWRPARCIRLTLDLKDQTHH